MIDLSTVKKITIENGKEMAGQHVVVRGDELEFVITQMIRYKHYERRVTNFRGEIVYTVNIEYKE